ncbi:hypothetical protein GCM10027590_33890 [Nocardiopsis nanhaiensis]
MTPSGHPETLTGQALCADGAAVRDSKNPAKGHMPFPSAEWAAFLTSTRS